MRTASALESFQVLIEKVFTRISTPKVVHVDRGTSFLALFQEGMARLGVKLMRSSSASPQSNTMAERQILKVHQRLRSYGAKHSDFHKYLPLVEFSINSSIHTRLGLSPFFIAHGIQPHFAVDGLLSIDEAKIAPRFEPHEREMYENIIKQINDVRRTVKERRREAEDVFEKAFNKRTQAERPSYTKGQLVYLKSRNIRPSKFESKYVGLMEVVKVLNSETYGQLLQLKDVNTNKVLESLIHPNRVKPSLDYVKQNDNIISKSTYDELVEVKAGEQPVITLTRAAMEKYPKVHSEHESIQTEAQSTNEQKSESSNAPETRATNVSENTTRSRVFYGNRRRQPQRRQKLH